MQRKILMAAGILGALAVVLGAFGAHALRDQLPPEKLVSYHTGVTYQFYHTLALLGVGLWLGTNASKRLYRAAWCFIIGIICFSGSIYLLSTCEDIYFLDDVLELDDRKYLLGPITPIGGVFFIVGWGMLFWEAKSIGVNKKEDLEH
ncbi:MAG: DUF423 domain-containing protein [Aureispira sp.]|nr:DUF423 domain-containing protein [Aureispira sp.]